ncbi:hypothetical protein Tco_0370079 [Tanacetum coccineum]
MGIHHAKAPNPSRLSKNWKSFKHPKNSSILSKPDRAHICTINKLEQNEEWVNAMVDGLNAEMTDGAAHSKSGGSERVSFGLIDVVVTLSASEKGDGFLPFSTVDEEATTNPSRV